MLNYYRVSFIITPFGVAYMVCDTHICLLGPTGQTAIFVVNATLVKSHYRS